MINELLLEEPKSTVFVFSHPNHELASIGMIARLQPCRIIYITDGGGENRCNETKNVLSELGLTDNAVFMNLSEDSFYKAILRLDCEYLKKISRRIMDELEFETSPYVFCDAVEFYNPIHDMTFPIVKSLGRSSNVFEIPLAYQNLFGDIVLQKPPESLKSNSICISLTESENHLKKYLFQSKYKSLGNEMERLIEADVSLTKFEWLIKDREFPILPMYDQVIRYNIRGSELTSKMTYAQPITYKENYVPLTTRILKNE